MEGMMKGAYLPGNSTVVIKVLLWPGAKSWEEF
jgi:hypothetical protein